MAGSFENMGQVCLKVTQLTFWGVLASIVVLLVSSILFVQVLREKKNETESKQTELASRSKAITLVCQPLILFVLIGILVEYSNRCTVLVMSAAVSSDIEDLPPQIIQQRSVFAEMELTDVAAAIVQQLVGSAFLAFGLSHLLIVVAVLNLVFVLSDKSTDRFLTYTLVVIVFWCVMAGFHMADLRSQMNWIQDLSSA